MIRYCLPLFCFVLLAQTGAKLPAFKKQPSVQAVIDEHLDALNRCDWNRLGARSAGYI